MIINGFETEFDIGDIVYEIVDTDNSKMMVVGFEVMVFGIKYICASHNNVSQYFEFEISKDKSFS